MEIARSQQGRNNRRSAMGVGCLQAQIWSDPSIAVNVTSARTARNDRPVNDVINEDQVRRELREAQAVADEFAVSADRDRRIRDAMARVNLEHARRERGRGLTPERKSAFSAISFSNGLERKPFSRKNQVP